MAVLGTKVQINAPINQSGSVLSYTFAANGLPVFTILLSNGTTINNVLLKNIQEL